jgi:hypothetical protein
MWRFAARAPGLASGLALAVRPAGPVEAPGSTARRRRVPRSGMRSTVEAGGTGPDNVRRSGTGDWTFRQATGASGASMTAWSCSRGAASAAVTAGTGLRPVAGQPCATAAAPVGLPPGRARAKLPPRNGETPGNPGRFRPVILAAHCPLSCSRPFAEPGSPAASRGAPQVRP